MLGTQRRGITQIGNMGQLMTKRNYILLSDILEDIEPRLERYIENKCKEDFCNSVADAWEDKDLSGLLKKLRAKQPDNPEAIASLIAYLFAQLLEEGWISAGLCHSDKDEEVDMNIFDRGYWGDGDTITLSLREDLKLDPDHMLLWVKFFINEKAQKPKRRNI